MGLCPRPRRGSAPVGASVKIKGQIMVVSGSLRARATEELMEFSVLAIYLYIALGALVLLKSAILHDVGVSFTVWGVALVKALVLAKFMLIGRALRIAERQKHRPLIWPTLYKSLAYLLLLLALTTVEEAVVGYFRGRPLVDSMAHVVGPTLAEGVATIVILFLVLVPYFAFRSLGDVIGDRSLARLFFTDRDALGRQP